MHTALRATRTSRHHHARRVPLSVLAQLIAGDTLNLDNPCAAFAIHPDRTAVITRHDGTTTLRPDPDGLYNIDPSGTIS
jgi:hypothetical protein